MNLYHYGTLDDAIFKVSAMRFVQIFRSLEFLLEKMQPLLAQHLLYEICRVPLDFRQMPKMARDDIP